MSIGMSSDSGGGFRFQVDQTIVAIREAIREDDPYTLGNQVRMLAALARPYMTPKEAEEARVRVEACEDEGELMGDGMRAFEVILEALTRSHAWGAVGSRGEGARR